MLSESVASAAHDVHALAPPDEHVSHDAWQAVHVSPSAHLPAGQLSRHAPRSECLVPFTGHVRQEVADGPEQVRHEASHDEQRACVPTSSEKVSAGQLATQPPWYRKAAAALVQLRHSDADGPKQVEHDGSHAAQTPLLFANLARGLHDATHDDGGKRRG